MHRKSVASWHHDHTFGQDRKRAGETRTLVVVLLTGVMMVAEVAAGISFGSMALLADGLHMASHASALTVTLVAYIVVRRNARDRRFSFGTGKLNSLGGFAGAILLVVFALVMSWESIGRLITPVTIAFDQAVAVAVVGLLVNLISFLILNHHDGDSGEHHHDHNLRAACLHVLADGLTSLLAIFALLVAKYVGLLWMDPVMGLIGAALVTRWSWGLLRSTTRILLDWQAPKSVETAVRDAIEKEADNRVADLHIWSIGPGIYSVIISVVTSSPKQPEHYKQLLPDGVGLVHRTVEVHKCDGRY
jgi:cation diffusion facilitator family transporter